MLFTGVVQTLKETGMLFTLAALAMPQDAVAQDRSERRRARGEEQLVREVWRGVYAKTNVGTSFIIPVTARSAASYPGVVFLGLGVGGEFIDRERFSAAFEASFSQGLAQGPRTESLVLENSLTQGDVHMFMGTGVVELSTYPTRRFGVGIRAGGGVMVMPLFLDRGSEQFDALVAGLGGDSTFFDGVHDTALPMVLGGPTIEYYTKLSHFSVGVDADFMYAFGFNPGVFASAYLKYTFGGEKAAREAIRQ
ncbi:MAG: adventurous gliding motility protein CglE [Myxococcota bacterium]